MGRCLSAACLALAAGAACSSGGGSAGGVDGPSDGRPVAVVSDSEITAEIVDLVDGDSGVAVVYRHNQPGATIAELDADLDRALAEEPEALVYSAGANDLLASGIDAMLDDLQVRLDRAGAATCVVYAVPAVDVGDMAESEAELTRAVLEGFSTVLDDWGVIQVPYLAIADDMAAEGDDFFAAGELGSFHPGPAAYPRIADALTRALEDCP